MKSNTTQQIGVIMIISISVATISILSVVTAEISVFADESEDDIQTNQMNKCNTDTGGTSTASADAPKGDWVSTSSATAVTETDLVCSTNVEILDNHGD
jgi:hypothetical protein